VLGGIESVFGDVTKKNILKWFFIIQW
jgi:hypothetical protein